MVFFMEKTKVLLISMPDTFMGFGITARLPNLGLVSMAGNRNPDECEIGVFDLVLRRHRVIPALKNVMDRFQPDFVGLSCMTFQYFTARNIAKWIREEYNPDIKIIFGGYHPTLCYEEIGQNYIDNQGSNNFEDMKSCPWCDYIIRGEGEITLKELIHAYRNDKPMENVLGLSWRGSDGKFRHNESRPNVDLNKLKLPDRSSRLINKSYHSAGITADMVETSRGCSNLCKFCSIAQMYGRKVRYYPLDRVIEDIRACKDIGARSIVFIDDNITLNPKRFEKLCDKIIEEGLNDIHYQTQASAAGLLKREKLIYKMGKAGFNLCFFGIENINPKNLDFFEKSVPVTQIKTLVKKLHQNNIISLGGFILGNPDDKLSDIKMNVKFAKYLDLDAPAYQILVPFPKTEIREELIKQNLITNMDDYSKYHGLYANVKTKYLDSRTLERELFRAFYRSYTPAWFVRRLSRMFEVNHYYKYAWQIIKKLYKTAISSWKTTYFGKKEFKSLTEAENVVINGFRDIHDHRLDDLINIDQIQYNSDST